MRSNRDSAVSARVLTSPRSYHLGAPNIAEVSGLDGERCTRRSSRSSSLSFSFLEAKQVSVAEQPVEARVGLATLTHEASQSDDVLLSSHFAILVDLESTQISDRKRAQIGHSNPQVSGGLVNRERL